MRGFERSVRGCEMSVGCAKSNQSNGEGGRVRVPEYITVSSPLSRISHPLATPTVANKLLFRVPPPSPH